MRYYILRIAALLLFLAVSIRFAHSQYLDTFREEPEISMDFQDANLKDILKIFSIQSGLNFIASESVQERRVTLYLDKVPLAEAMDKLFRANNLTYELDRNSNIFIVKDWGKPQIETVTKVFFLKYATVSSSSLKEEMGKQINVESSLGGESSSGSGSSGGSRGSGTSGKWATEEDAGLTKAVKKLLSEYGSVIEDYRTNSLIITDIPSKMSVIAQVIEMLDVPTPQVLLEVEMLDVSKNVVDSLGVNWPTTIAKLTVPGSRETRFPFGDKGTSGRGRLIDPDKDVFGGGWDFGAWNASHFGPTILTVIGTTLTLDFLRSQTDTKFLARPKIITLNNETAEIKIATNESIGVKETTTSSGGGTGSTTQEAERTQTGVILRVTPQINSETGEITMFIYPKVAEAVAGNTITSGSNNFRFRDPEERSTKSIIRVKDGETVVIGGLIRNEAVDTKEKLPILGDIPIIGALFRHRGSDADKNKERELLVFITPHIIKERFTQNAPVTGVKNLTSRREQSVVSEAGRQRSINAALNSFEGKAQ
ncbi:MAG: secretin and TonB N-terminal domain-containing protein [Candidatus Omnitrophica bacterium]|nr:secretin and TonB N-terminal domain-containing protein [Candidatus Omnitrophota bacterium]